MGDEFTERRGVSREDLRSMERNFNDKFTAHETLDNARFEAMEKIHQERHEAVRLRLEAVGKNVHDLRGQLTEVFALPGRVDQIVDELKNVPRNKDMDHLSETISTRFDSFEQARREEKKRDEQAAARFRWIVGVSMTVGIPVLMLLLNIWARSKGWL